MVIGNLNYLIVPASGLYPHPLDLFPWAHGECKSSHGLASFCGSWTSVLEGVALIHNTERKGKS
jgi:hypothetical protein